VRGALNTQVKIVVERGNNLLSFAITRQNISLKNAYGQTLDNNIGYIKLLQFGYTSASDFTNVCNNLAGKVKGLIIDMRGNGGGELSNAITIASLFLPAGQTIMWYRDMNTNQAINSLTGAKLSLPVVLLIDEETASAAEIVSAAWLENGSASAVGVKTYGKGTVQTRTYLSDLSAIYLTVAEFYSPNKNAINVNGLSPTLNVAIADQDILFGNDTQLLAAINELENKPIIKSLSVFPIPSLSSQPTSLPPILRQVVDYQQHNSL
jgi:carboxyl-terminal processing protease